MHIAMGTVCPDGPDRIEGGVAGCANYLVEVLSMRPDLKVSVIVPKRHTDKTVRQTRGGCDIIRVPKKGFWKFLPATLYDLISGRRQIRAILENIKPDIVHFQGVTFLAADCTWPNVLTIHGIVEQDALWDKRLGPLRWAKWLLLKLTEDYGRRRVPHLILISEYVKKFLPGRNRIRKTWLIENPIANSYFDVEWAPEPARLFCSSRVRTLKNTLGLIKAFALVAQCFPDSTLRIAGASEPGYMPLCEREVATHNLDGKVQFLGNISIANVQDELAKANCLVLPSFQENAPLSIEEAMAVGVPVVAARVGGVPELVEDGKTGLLIDPHDTQEIAEAICKILADRKLAEAMSKHAKSIARQRFMASSVCERTLAVYDQILSGEPDA